MMAASSLALFPDAKAVRNSVFSNKFVGLVVTTENSGEEKVSKTLSIDHRGF